MIDLSVRGLVKGFEQEAIDTLTALINSDFSE